MKKILAIDPGTTHSAFVIWDGEKIIESGKVPNFRLKIMVSDFLCQNENVKVYCEMIASYGMAVGEEVFKTCLFIGRLQEQAPGIEPDEFNLVYRKDIKMHLCGSMRAKDSNIRQALIDRFGPPGVKKSPGITYGLSGDSWSAFAVAVYSWDKLPVLA